MVSARKRLLDDRGPSTAADEPQPSPELRRLRNMWQFACLCQWLYIFGPAVKLDTPDIDELEAQCLSPHSTALQEIGLALLKYLSSHRGLTADLFDEYTRRQYVAKAPELPNPFGADEIPDKFSEFDAFKKVRVLHQMTQFVMMNSEKLRDKMAEQKDADQDQTSWRIEPFGWDSNDNTYFVLDDNRVYRLRELPPVPSRPKKNTKKARAQARRASKRRRVSTATSGNGMEDEAEDTAAEADAEPKEDDEVGDEGLGGMKWECVAVSLDEIRQLLDMIPGRKDANEKILHSKIVDHLLPIIEQQEEKRKKREKEREKELLNLAKLAHAKRSSRIAGRQEQVKQEEIQREEETKRRHDEETRRKEEQKLRKLERDRDNRLMSRENRLRERELRRLQHQEELSQLSEDGKSVSSAGGPGRISERQRAAEIKKTREALRELEQEDEEEEWVFDCVCGLHGKVDDGQHSVSCERCNIWQHSRCLGINEDEAEKDDFHFVCSSCRRRSREAETGVRSPIVKIKVNRPAATSNSANGTVVPQPVVRSALEPPREGASSGIPVKIDAASMPALASTSNSFGADPVLKPAEMSNGIHNPFSSPHPELSPPGLSPRKSHAYDTIYEQVSPTPQVGLMRKFGDHSLSPSIAIRAPALLLRPTNGKTAGGPPPSPTKPRAEGPAGEPSGLSQPSSQTVLFPPPTPSSASSARVMNELSGQQQRTPSVVMTPRLHHPQRDGPDRGQRAQTLSPLLPSHGGLSPTKQSPSVNDFSSSFPSSSPTPPIFPPAAALSPSAPKQDPTPPIKSGSFVYRQVPGGPPSERKSSPAARE